MLGFAANLPVAGRHVLAVPRQIHNRGNDKGGDNLFSLASDGDIYLRDPHHRVNDEQLNGGVFVDLRPGDWELIEPYL